MWHFFLWMNISFFPLHKGVYVIECSCERLFSYLITGMSQFVLKDKFPGFFSCIYTTAAGSFFFFFLVFLVKTGLVTVLAISTGFLTNP